MSDRKTHMAQWTAMARPPSSALKTIKGGRLQGMTDVNPQWRYQAMTEQYGPCGAGWKYTIDRLWTEKGPGDEVMAFAQVSVYILIQGGESWRDPIPGVGGNHLIAVEKSGARGNDECWKMAITDALSVAMKMLGVAADIYAGLWDGSKYREAPATATPSSVERIELPAGTYQIIDVRRQTWGGEVICVDSHGEEYLHKSSDQKVLDDCRVCWHDAVPVTLLFGEITRGVNKGKLKLTAVHKYAPPVPVLPVAEPTTNTITADDIAF